MNFFGNRLRFNRDITMSLPFYGTRCVICTVGYAKYSFAELLMLLLVGLGGCRLSNTLFSSRLLIKSLSCSSRTYATHWVTHIVFYTKRRTLSVINLRWSSVELSWQNLRRSACRGGIFLSVGFGKKLQQVLRLFLKIRGLPEYANNIP